jgi:serine/threonine protein kinase
MVTGEQQRITGTGMRMGTPYYMSPEAWHGEPLDHQADVWSVGVVLFEMLTGELPFQGKSELIVMRAVIQEPAPDTRKLNPNVPLGLAKIIERLLAKDKAIRYQSIRLVSADLERGEPAEESSMRRVSPITALRGWLAGAAVLILLVIVGAILLAGGGDDLDDGDQTSTAIAELPTSEPSETPTDTPQPSETPTETPQPSETPTETQEPSETPAPTDSPTDSPSPTETEPPTATETVVPTNTPTPTPSLTLTHTPTITATEIVGLLVPAVGVIVDEGEVTQAEFINFVRALGYQTQAYWSVGGWEWLESTAPLAPPDTDESIIVTWYEADAYCRWREARLPTDVEWQAASDLGEAAGLLDMVGGLREWTSDIAADGRYVVRGGGAVGETIIPRESVRPDPPFNEIGFRCVTEP